jgi:hypothetical protein
MIWRDQLNPTVVSSLTGVIRVSLGDAIDLVIGQSVTATVPNLHGDTIDQVGTALQAAGLAARSLSARHHVLCLREGRIWPPSGGILGRCLKELKRPAIP